MKLKTLPGWLLLFGLILAACAQAGSTAQPADPIQGPTGTESSHLPTSVPEIEPTNADANGLALAWHREGGIAGFCDDLVVYMSGEIAATTCKNSQPNDLGTLYLPADQLEQLYAWIDELKPFEIDQTDPATADAITIRLVFAGNGVREATDAEKQAILDYAAQVYTELSN